MTTARRSRALWAEGKTGTALAGTSRSYSVSARIPPYAYWRGTYVVHRVRAGRTVTWMACSPSRHRGVASAEGFLTAASARGGLRARDRISLRNRRSRRRSFSSSTPWLLPPLLTRPHPSCSPRERGPPFSLSISFNISLYVSFSLGARFFGWPSSFLV